MDRYKGALAELNTVRWNTMNQLYPFIEPHTNAIQTLRSSGFLDKKAVTDSSIPVIWMLYEVQHSVDGTMIESLVGQGKRFKAAANFMVAHFILSAEYDVEAIEIDTVCDLTVSLGHGSPEKLVFKSPGGKLPCAVRGRVIELMITGNVILLNKIKFHGKAVENDSQTADAPSLTTSGAAYHPINVRSTCFNRLTCVHEIDFGRSIDLVGVRFQDLSVIQPHVVIEVNSHVYHCTLAMTGQQSADVFLPNIVIGASRMCIWYRNVETRLLPILTTADPVPLENGK